MVFKGPYLDRKNTTFIIRRFERGSRLAAGRRRPRMRWAACTPRGIREGGAGDPLSVYSGAFLVWSAKRVIDIVAVRDMCVFG